MYLFKSNKYIKIKKFGELRVGDVFFFNELPFIKLDNDYTNNSLCLEDIVYCTFNYGDDVEYQWCGFFRSHSYKGRNYE